MSTLSKLALGVMGQLRPKPHFGPDSEAIVLPPAVRYGGMPLMEAFAARRSEREFAPTELPLSTMSNLLWAAWGVNRPDGGRTAPSAINAQEIDLYVALASGAFLYDAAAHTLRRVAADDIRRVTGYQDFVDDAPMDLVFVANHRRLALVPVEQRARYASVAAGAISQNVYLYAASNGLATVIRAWIDRAAVSNALGLGHDEEVLLSQTVGFRKDPEE